MRDELVPSEEPKEEPAPLVTPLRGPEEWEILGSAGPQKYLDPMPDQFEEVLRATRASVGHEGFAYDGTIAVATSLQVDLIGKCVGVGLSPKPYSCILASRSYGQDYGYHLAPYRPAISSVLIKTADGLWVLGQRSASVDISKGKAGFSAGGFVHPDLVGWHNAFELAALRELTEELGVEADELSDIHPTVLITSWRKVEVSYLATTVLSMQQVRARAATAVGREEHQHIVGVRPGEHARVLQRYGTWPGVQEALAEALAHTS